MPSSTVCDFSDFSGAAHALGGKFEREDCGFFEECTHRVEKYDMTIEGGSVVEIWYCTIDWRKTGPIILGVVVLMWFLYRKIKSMGSIPAERR